VPRSPAGVAVLSATDHLAGRIKTSVSTPQILTNISARHAVFQGPAA
jgi:hypothetical protein